MAAGMTVELDSLAGSQRTDRILRRLRYGGWVLCIVGLLHPVSDAMGLPALDWLETILLPLGFVLLYVCRKARRNMGFADRLLAAMDRHWESVQRRAWAWRQWIAGQQAVTRQWVSGQQAATRQAFYRTRLEKALFWPLLIVGVGLLVAGNYVPFDEWWRTDILRVGTIATWLGLVAVTLALVGFVLGPKILLAANAFVLFGIVTQATITAAMPLSERGFWGDVQDYPWGNDLARSATGVQWSKREFIATYHMTPDGHRRTPAPKSSQGDVLCLGCSFTFGAGVEDDEAYPALLASKHWPTHHVYNCGVNGTGVGTALLLMEHWLKSRPAPAAALYGWIPNHSVRNQLRGSFHQGLGRWFPAFDVQDGQLVRLGPMPHDDAALPDSHALTRKEYELTLVLFEELRGLCQKHDVPLYVLSLETPNYVMRRLAERGFQVIDVSPAGAEPGSYFPKDRHPTAAWHERAARLIAEKITP